MGSDAVVARGRATVDGLTLFGQNLHGPSRLSPRICFNPGRDFAPGEMSGVSGMSIPQVRHTQTVLGLQTTNSSGFRAGLNSAKVAVGCFPLETRLREPSHGLSGPDLVRLVLERSHSACQAVETLVSLIDRHGQGGASGEIGAGACDHAFLIADPLEAVLVETAGKYWVVQQLGDVRALVSVRTIRQDWDRISHAFSEYAIGEGAWPEDGSKVDFVSALGDAPEQHPLALSRWGRAMVLLEEQNGHIDTGFVRQLLRDHADGMEGAVPAGLGKSFSGLCRHTGKLTGVSTRASFLTALSNDPAVPPIAWVAFGPPCISVYFPIVVGRSLPDAIVDAGPESLAEQIRKVQKMNSAIPETWPDLREAFVRLQTEYDQCVEEFVQTATADAGVCHLAERDAQALMEHCLARLEATLALAFEQGAPALAFTPGT